MALISSTTVGIAVALLVAWVIHKLFIADIVPPTSNYLTMPGPPTRFGKWFGDIPYRPFTKQHQFFRVLVKEYGGMVRRRLFGRNIIVIGDAKIANEILANREVYPDRTHIGLNDILPKGLLGLRYGPEWHHHRKVVSTVFADRFLRLYSSIFTEKTQTLVTVIRKQGDNYVDIHDLISKMALDAIGSSGFGVEFNALTDDVNSTYISAAKRVALSVLLRTMMPSFFYYLANPQVEFDMRKGYETFEKEARKIFNGDGQNREAKTLLDVLKAENFSENDTVQELITLILAGHETTANTLAWSCHLLGQHPEIQKKAQEEVDQIFEDPSFDNKFFENRKRFVYINAIIHESLRLYPTVPIVPRICVQDTKLNGYDIPAGAYMYMSNAAMARNPAYWDRPDDFIPDRFLGEGEKLIDTAFIPFGAGPRVCVGRRFALLEATTVLSTLIRHFNFETKMDHEVDEFAHITLGSNNGIFVKCIPRVHD